MSTNTGIYCSPGTLAAQSGCRGAEDFAVKAKTMSVASATLAQHRIPPLFLKFRHVLKGRDGLSVFIVHTER